MTNLRITDATFVTLERHKTLVGTDVEVIMASNNGGILLFSLKYWGSAGSTNTQLIITDGEKFWRVGNTLIQDDLVNNIHYGFVPVKREEITDDIEQIREAVSKHLAING